MFKLFRKEIKPRVYAFICYNKKDAKMVTIGHGYDLEEAWQNAKDSDKDINQDQKFSAWVHTDLEDLCNEYTPEKVALESIKQ